MTVINFAVIKEARFLKEVIEKTGPDSPTLKEIIKSLNNLDASSHLDDKNAWLNEYSKEITISHIG